MANYLECSQKFDGYCEGGNLIWGKKRKACACTHAQPHVEGWVKGWARLDRSTGAVDIAMELETDHVDKGPCGRIYVEMWGANKRLAAVESGGLCIGGKPSGKAVASVFTASTSIPASTAAKVDEVRVRVECTGSSFAPFGINPGDIFTVIVALLGGG